MIDAQNESGSDADNEDLLEIFARDLNHDENLEEAELDNEVSDSESE
jgi:hypothetical protein